MPISFLRPLKQLRNEFDRKESKTRMGVRFMKNTKSDSNKLFYENFEVPLHQGISRASCS